MPAGVPHGGTIFSDERGPVRNLVGGFCSGVLRLHPGHEVAPHKPDIEAIEFFEASNLKCSPP